MDGLVIAPTPAFWVSLLPVPFLAYYNLVVAWLIWKVRLASRGNNVRYPAIYHQGRALGLLSACFALIPAVLEWRVFVLSPYWSVSYLLGGVLGVWALELVRRGLKQELARPTARSKRTKTTSSKKSS